MTTFYVSETPGVTMRGKKYPGRVILDVESHGDIIQTIEADAVTDKDGGGEERVIVSAWQVARAKVAEENLVKDDWHGWYRRQPVHAVAAA